MKKLTKERALQLSQFLIMMGGTANCSSTPLHDRIRSIIMERFCQDPTYDVYEWDPKKERRSMTRVTNGDDLYDICQLEPNIMFPDVAFLGNLSSLFQCYGRESLITLVSGKFDELVEVICSEIEDDYYDFESTEGVPEYVAAIFCILIERWAGCHSAIPESLRNSKFEIFCKDYVEPVALCNVIYNLSPEEYVEMLINAYSELLNISKESAIAGIPYYCMIECNQGMMTTSSGSDDFLYLRTYASKELAVFLNFMNSHPQYSSEVTDALLKAAEVLKFPMGKPECYPSKFYIEEGNVSSKLSEDEYVCMYYSIDLSEESLNPLFQTANEVFDCLYPEFIKEISEVAHDEKR